MLCINWSIVRRLPWCIWCRTHLSFLLTLFPSGSVDFPGVTICQVGIEKSQFGPSKEVIKGAWPQLGLGEMCVINHMLSVWPSLRILAHPAVLLKKRVRSLSQGKLEPFDIQQSVIAGTFGAKKYASWLSVMTGNFT